VIRNKPFAKKFYGAMVAGPVFREVADKLVALKSERIKGSFDERNNEAFYSTAFYYAGYTTSLKEVLAEVKIKYADSTDRSDWSMLYANNEKQVISKQNIARRTIPNVKGMGLKDAIYLMESMDIKVKSSGIGKVVSQSISPGTPILKNQIVTLELD